MAKNYTRELMVFVFVSFLFGFVTPFFFVKSFFGAEKNTTLNEDSMGSQIKNNKKKFEDIEFLYADIYKSKGR